MFYYLNIHTHSCTSSSDLVKHFYKLHVMVKVLYICGMIINLFQVKDRVEAEGDRLNEC